MIKAEEDPSKVRTEAVPMERLVIEASIFTFICALPDII